MATALTNTACSSYSEPGLSAFFQVDHCTTTRCSAGLMAMLWPKMPSAQKVLSLLAVRLGSASLSGAGALYHHW
ncbi:hypothetical protein [Pseudomonas mosselii]|uniref:hypothetical protein n=1 Tax=Pseudomonas mosselii TaxID=78327 RepID=UPI001F29B7C5|nr:hypothetical protein [Pseudomonas mosselii]